jgi:two-component system KDP operon response regulator KdpE
MEMIMTSRNYKILRAHSGAGGLFMFMNHQPDVILLDLGLPDIDGMEVLRQIRGFSNVPVIVVSARTQEYEKVQALDSGADDYLTKPFSSEELMARIPAVFLPMIIF